MTVSGFFNCKFVILSKVVKLPVLTLLLESRETTYNSFPGEITLGSHRISMANSDADAASEALMRKLHRELNGLKPRSSRMMPVIDKVATKLSTRPKAEERQGSEVSSSGSEEGDAKPIKRKSK